MRLIVRVSNTGSLADDAVVAALAKEANQPADMKLVGIKTSGDGVAEMIFYDSKGPWTEATTPVIDLTKET